jgi:glucose-6-phosphate 1-dehydrogenase
MADTESDRSADLLVIFGIAGDLARKMTFPALYRLERAGKLDCPIIGVARRADWVDDTLRGTAREALEETVGAFDREVFARLAARMRFVPGDYGEAETYRRLGQAMGEARRPVFYLEVPPAIFAPVVAKLGEAGLVDGARVVIEKPFGHDLESAASLQAELREVLEEEQILRIDHYLGKEPVMDITYLRFANSVLEPVWNRGFVSHVQMTIAEDFGVEERGAFYDPVGALRDVVQNHMLQVLALVAMEPPAGNHRDSIRDKKVELLKAIRPADPEKYVRGQYEGYRDVEGVADDSNTETYAALELDIDNWRWSGVPFFLRAGKCLPVKHTEVNVFFHRPPRLGVGSGPLPEPNRIVIRVDPLPGALFRVFAKKGGVEDFDTADLKVLFKQVPGGDPEPYERLLGDALDGRDELFLREDSIEESWRVVEPLLEDPPPVEPYAPGSWGPKGAGKLLRGVCDWYEPWRPGQEDTPSR